MTISDETARAAFSPEGGRVQANPSGPESDPGRQTVDQRAADAVLLLEVLIEASAEERLLARDELLERFLERAASVAPLTVVEVERELATLPDPRFEGPDSETVAYGIERAKAMADAQPGTSPDPHVPGIRKTRRMLSRRGLLLGLLHPGQQGQADEGASQAQDSAAEGQVRPDQTAGVRPPEPAVVQASPGRELDRPWAEALLVEVEADNPDVASLTAWNGTVYYHFRPLLSGLYARILATGDNPALQVANVVRESSRDYPRPVPVEMFEYPPFNFTPETLQECLKRMDGEPDFADIRFTESSVGTVYLYSSMFLEEDYAAFLAENQDLGAIKSP